MNLSLLDTKILQLINQYSINGSLIPTSSGTIQDYLLRTRNLIDACQKELALKKKIPATKYISQNSIPNQITGLIGQQLYQHLLQDITFNAMGSKSYYFEVDKPCTITIELNGVVQTTLNLSPTEFTAYKGFITSISSDNVVIRFSGSYPYNIQNVALYAYSFPSVDDIPQYRAYNIYPLPTDFMELQNLKIEQFPYSYINISDYFLQYPNLLINSLLAGNISVNYYRYPTTITVDSPPTTELEIMPDAQELIPYYVAGHVYLEDNPTISTMLLNEYQTKKAQLQRSDEVHQNIIECGWGW